MKAIVSRSVRFAATLAALLAGSSASADVIGFDDLPGSTASVPDGYHGLNWTNFEVLTADDAAYDNTGYQQALISPHNVAFGVQQDGLPIRIWVFAGSTFTLDGGYFTAAWDDGLRVEAVGSLLGVAVAGDDVAFVLSATAPTFETFGFVGVDSVVFTITPGTPHAGYNGSGTQFAVDNLSFGAVPEPGTFALMALGASALVVARARRRRPVG